MSFYRRETNACEAIRLFEEELVVHRDQLFGITLFSQGIELMYSSQPEIIAANKQSFANIRDRAEATIQAAEVLLTRAKNDPKAVPELLRFEFPPITGHPMLDELTNRAQVLVRTYNRLFPNRSRADALKTEEMARLMGAASNEL